MKPEFKLLDRREFVNFVSKGAALLDLVFNHLEVGEREYFGLMFNDTGNPMPVGHAPDVMRWLDPQKLVRKQVRTASRAAGNALLKTEKAQHNIITLYFRVKFYVTGNFSSLFKFVYCK